MEKTPSYWVTRSAPRRVYAMNPAVKLLAVVRDPVTRAISDYTQSARYVFITTLIFTCKIVIAKLFVYYGGNCLVSNIKPKLLRALYDDSILHS